MTLEKERILNHSITSNQLFMNAAQYVGSNTILLVALQTNW